VPRSWKSRRIILPTLWATTGPVTGTLYLFTTTTTTTTTTINTNTNTTTRRKDWLLWFTTAYKKSHLQVASEYFHVLFFTLGSVPVDIVWVFSCFLLHTKPRATARCVKQQTRSAEIYTYGYLEKPLLFSNKFYINQMQQLTIC
jgi:hypothetical protein